MEEHDEWQQLINGLRAGDQEAMRSFCERYGDPLQRLAERNLASGMRRRVGPESIVQSACRTFLRRAQEGQFSITDGESLWRLMCAITLTKVRERVRFHRRQRREVDREVELGDEGDSRGSPAFEAVACGAGPEESAAIAECFEQLFESLEEEERRMVELKLQDHDNLEIADRMGCSERTVRRIMSRVRTRLERSLELK